MKKPHLSTAMTAFMLSLASLTLRPAGDLHAADIFTRVTTGPGGDAGSSRGSSWGDYDNDGFIDLFIPQIGASFLYHNNTNGTFSRVTTGPVAQVNGSEGGAWGDYDNDGNLDLVVMNLNQPNYLFRNNGSGSFAAVPSSVSSDVANSRCVTWVDYDNDGYVDIFRAGEDGPRRLYHNNHEGTFTRITGPEFLTVPGGFLGVAWADYNHDGLPDLFLPSSAEPAINYLYRNDEGGRFTRVGAGMMDGNGNQTGGGAWGDYDNDGDLDIFASCAVTHAQGSAPNLFYRNDGNDRFTSLTSLPANDPESQGGASFGCTWGDYDNDGWLDLFVANLGLQNDFLYHNNGNGTFTKVPDSVVVKDAANGLAAAWGDYDNDGFLDLMVGNYSGTHLLYHNNGNDNHWLKFRLIGTFSNRAAIGAKVRVRATINGRTFWQMREVSGGDGVRGQNSLHVHVGLGNATNADLVRIEWPSGIVQELTNLAAQQFLTVTESGFGIVGQPQNLGVLPGGNVTNTVRGFSDRPLSYQWMFNGINLPGQTNASLIFTNVQLAQEGYYRVLVSDTVSNVLSDTANLVVLTRPVIINPPLAQTVLQGGTAVLSVTGTPDRPLLPLSYRWLRSATTYVAQGQSTLTVTNLLTNTTFRVQVTNLAGVVISAPVTVTVLADNDRDGMADDWESLNGFDSANAADATLDSDGDGMSNRDEYTAGTDPRGPSSRFKIESLTRMGTNAVVLQFQTVSNRTYTVQFSSEATSAVWTNLAHFDAQITNATERLTNSLPQNAAREFYRIVTPRQP